MRIAKQIRLVFLAVLLVAALPSAIAQAAEVWNYRQYTKIAWRSYGTAAFDEARRTQRPLFVLIHSDQCGWCRKYEVEALEQPRIRSLLETRFIPVAVDNDREKAIGKKLGAKLVPTSLILAPDGKKLLRFYGVQSAADLADTLQETLVLWRRDELPQPDFGSMETCCPVINDGTAGDGEKGRPRN